ncbi:hypothetical protein [Streptomyces sp. NPDC026673]|uniref:hypothetical protein n=1 Tax=Streptomyces sp. NPDC026673 TaxID=3155724 RepID=UPI0033EE9C2F
MIVMVGFYFGGKTAEKVVEKKHAAGPAPTAAPPPETTGDHGATVTSLPAPATAADGGPA